jgi:perosamine synthetase
VHPRHRLDLRPADVGHGLLAVVTARGRRRRERELLTLVDAAEDGFAALSVRAAWNLLLTACAWPAGSEVVLSAITHPGMAALVGEAGLVAVPVEVDLDTLLPDVAALEAVTTDRTRAVLVAQLFGGRADLTEVAAFCRRRGLLLVEDAAQAWTGPATLRSPADVTLVSFGLLKTATAAGGALVRVADPALLLRVRRLHRTWPVQGRLDHAARLLRALALLLLAEPGAYGAFLVVCRVLGVSPGTVLERATRTPAPGPGRRVRLRPSSALLVTMAHRLSAADASPARVRSRTAAGERLRAALPDALRQPGAGVARTHWIFPVRSADPEALVARLRTAGVDASAATSNLVALLPDGPGSDLMRHVVYVPAYPELPAHVRTAVQRVLAEQ